MEKTSNNKAKILLVNETFIIDHSIHEEWLAWFTNTYIISIKKSDFTRDFVLSKIQDNNPDGMTYALQFKINEIDFTFFQEEERLIELRNIMNKSYANKFASFVTILEIIQD